VTGKNQLPTNPTNNHPKTEGDLGVACSALLDHMTECSYPIKSNKSLNSLEILAQDAEFVAQSQKGLKIIVDYRNRANNKAKSI